MLAALLALNLQFDHLIVTGPAVGVDLWTTERGIAAGAREGNPLPGMQTTPGRIAWGAAELGALSLVKKKKLRWALAIAVVVTRSAAAIHNDRVRRQLTQGR